MKRTRSSERWIREHESDVYVQRAREAGLRSRAVYKLEEIERTDHLLRPGITVVDLGAAPGGWSQFAARRLGRQGRVIALDLLPMEPLEGVEFVQADFSDESALQALLARLAGEPVQLVMSDMAPNMSGLADVDHLKSMHLVELALDFAERVLAPGGDFLVKVFQGRDLDGFVARLRSRFESVKWRKPKASRSRSNERYLLARNYRM
ncbi:MAG TPA: 23S rRNA (uridine(2552)-2'-O)-methyltransferase RlmE [Steroidobacteraceae bacterium]|nr:23S rRNA (uridine(2552)-2'-O)-methyltransferase RlmE [Steroidobacteraceae bacterium]